MNQVLRTHFSNLFRDSVNEARKEIFPSGTKKFVADDILPEEFLSVLEAESFKIVGDYATDMTKRATNRLIAGIKNGVSEGKLVALIRDDIDGATDRWLSTLVRTKTTEIYNTARKTLWDTDPLISQIIEAYEFSAIMDDRVSDVCASLDGKVYEKGEFTSQITPPLHPNCRSLLIPVTKFEEYTASKPPSLESLVEKGGSLIPHKGEKE
jgi:SPP1 gp7 family putative phage head morphogenesis protein